jgi:hypothetical protein
MLALPIAQGSCPVAPTLPPLAATPLPVMPVAAQGPLSGFATTRPMGRRSLAPIFRVGPLPTFRPARRGA